MSNVSSGSSDTHTFRLVHPEDAAIEPAVIDFESAYKRTLPRMPLTEAHRLVEQIRAKLVAGTVDLSLRFDHPFSDTDPSILEFIDQTSDAAEMNFMATERRASRCEG